MIAARARHRLQHPPGPRQRKARRPGRQGRLLHCPRYPRQQLLRHGHPRHHPAEFRGKQSRDAWSSCGSCHPDGLADGVTWIFGTGPRQTKPLDGMFNKFTNMEDQGLLNWNAIRGSNTDFNNNSRGVQGAAASPVWRRPGMDPPAQCNPDHHAQPDAGEPGHLRPRHHTGGATPSTCRPCGSLPPCGRCISRNRTMRRRWGAGETSLRPIAPPATEEPNGRRARSSTATTPPPPCRTGRPWTPVSPGSRRRHAGGRRADERVLPFTCNALTINYLEDVGTFDDTDPLEIRDNAAAKPGVWAEWVQCAVLAQYQLSRAVPASRPSPDPRGGLPAARVGTAGVGVSADHHDCGENWRPRRNLLVFLKAIDGTTAHVRSEGDDFRDALRLQGPCPPPAPMMSSQPHA